MDVSINNDIVRELRDEIKNYVHDQVIQPLQADNSVKSSVVKDLQTRAQSIGDTSRQFSTLGRTMDDVSKKSIKSLTDSLFDLSKNTKTVKGVLHRELASLTQDLLEGLFEQIKASTFPTFSGQTSSSGGGLLDGLFGLAGNLLGFRAGGGSVAPGQAFVVGENGPELLVTGRTSGSVIPNSGQRSMGGGGGSPVNVTVVNNTSAEVSVQQRQNANGIRELEIMIDTMVAKSLSRGNSKAFQALESTYGLRPVLNGR